MPWSCRSSSALIRANQNQPLVPDGLAHRGHALEAGDRRVDRLLVEDCAEHHEPSPIDDVACALGDVPRASEGFARERLAVEARGDVGEQGLESRFVGRVAQRANQHEPRFQSCECLAQEARVAQERGERMKRQELGRGVSRRSCGGHRGFQQLALDCERRARGEHVALREQQPGCPLGPLHSRKRRGSGEVFQAGLESGPSLAVGRARSDGGVDPAREVGGVPLARRALPAAAREVLLTELPRADVEREVDGAVRGMRGLQERMLDQGLERIQGRERIRGGIRRDHRGGRFHVEPAHEHRELLGGLARLWRQELPRPLERGAHRGVALIAGSTTRAQEVELAAQILEHSLWREQARSRTDELERQGQPVDVVHHVLEQRRARALPVGLWRVLAHDLEQERDGVGSGEGLKPEQRLVRKPDRHARGEDERRRGRQLQELADEQAELAHHLLDVVDQQDPRTVLDRLGEHVRGLDLGHRRELDIERAGQPEHDVGGRARGAQVTKQRRWRGDHERRPLSLAGPLSDHPERGTLRGRR